MVEMIMYLHSGSLGLGESVVQYSGWPGFNSCFFHLSALPSLVLIPWEGKWRMPWDQLMKSLTWILYIVILLLFPGVPAVSWNFVFGSVGTKHKAWICFEELTMMKWAWLSHKWASRKFLKRFVSGSWGNRYIYAFI